MKESALIIGAGSGLSASLARLCSKKNMSVVLAARNIDKLKDLQEETKAISYQCDSSNIESVTNLFLELDKTIGTPNLVIYNAAARVRGGITELDSVQAQEAINVTCFGAFLVAAFLGAAFLAVVPLRVRCAISIAHSSAETLAGLLPCASDCLAAFSISLIRFFQEDA